MDTKYNLKKISLIFLYLFLIIHLMLFTACCSNRKGFLIKDFKIETAIRKDINKLKGDLTREDLLKVREIDAVNVSDLSGIEYCENLEILYLFHNKLHSIQHLQNCKKIKEIAFTHGKLKDISGLKNLVSLKSLSIDWNQIQDISVIASLINLTYLEMDFNKITDISPVSYCSELEKLSVQDNKLTFIPDLSSCKKLKEIYLANNEITDATMLINLDSIEYIQLYETKLQDISWLFKLKNYNNLKYLSVRGALDIDFSLIRDKQFPFKIEYGPRLPCPDAKLDRIYLKRKNGRIDDSSDRQQ